MESTERISKKRSVRRYRICIIGAGMAGLSAAELLAMASSSMSSGSHDCDDDVNIEVTILEAMDWAGGRARTLPFGKIMKI